MFCKNKGFLESSYHDVYEPNPPCQFTMKSAVNKRYLETSGGVFKAPDTEYTEPSIPEKWEFEFFDDTDGRRIHVRSSKTGLYVGSTEFGHAYLTVSPTRWERWVLIPYDEKSHTTKKGKYMIQSELSGYFLSMNTSDGYIKIAPIGYLD